MFAVPKYSWREQWCVATTTLRSMKYARGYLPSVESISSCAPGVLAGVAIRGSGKGGPFGIPSTARRVFAVTLSGGSGGVTGGTFRSTSTGWSCGVAECLADPLRAGWSAIGFLQEVAEVEDVVHHPVT